LLTTLLKRKFVVHLGLAAWERDEQAVRDYRQKCSKREDDDDVLESICNFLYFSV